MRYAQGGGLTAERRAFREQLRREAAERFVRGDATAAVARDLRVTVRSVQRWRKAWAEEGPRALASKGPASLPLLSDELFAVLERELDKGPVRAWLAGPDPDSVADQDPDRAPVPQELHGPGRRGPAQAARLALPGPRAGRLSGTRKR